MKFRGKVKGVAQFLRSVRIKKDITQIDAARSLGHSTAQYISNFERGLCEPSVEMALKLCEFYGVTKRELYDLMMENYQEALKEKIFPTKGRKKA